MINFGFEIPSFYLFGMGLRRKFLFHDGTLKDARNGEVVHSWDASHTTIDAFEYSISMKTRSGEVRLWEDEDGVWLQENDERQCLTRGAKIVLPRFEGNRYAGLLRALHADILINICEFGPVPNLFVYPRPWLRDAALMAMCLAQTGNIGLLEEWILNVPRVFDCNNFGHHEADNMGQMLYLLSLVGAHDAPQVQDGIKRVLESVPQFLQGDHICGLTDYEQHPVFQTKWLKFGLRRLGLDDPYCIPNVYDAYSSLFWMDFRDQHVTGAGFSADTSRLYPYLAWGEAHFHNSPPPLHFLNDRYPFTWEGSATDAYYAGISKVSPTLTQHRLCAPHTWHAAEAWLYLIENPI